MRAWMLPCIAVVVAGCQFQPTLEAAGGGASDSRCPPADDDTLALYTFDQDDGTTIADAHGEHPATLHNAAAPPLIDGPDGCGSAIAFPEDAAGGSEMFVEVPHHDDWRLEQGSIDLWVRPAPGSNRGVVSRDAFSTAEDGHLTLFQGYGPFPDRFVARIQRIGDDSSGRYLCADGPVEVGRWTHVGINFGPPGAELWIDGRRATANEVARDARLCNDGDTSGIDGNANPWGFGVDTGNSPDGEVSPVRSAFAGGAIDHVRISRVRRDYSALSE